MRQPGRRGEVRQVQRDREANRLAGVVKQNGMGGREGVKGASRWQRGRQGKKALCGEGGRGAGKEGERVGRKPCVWAGRGDPEMRRRPSRRNECDLEGGVRRNSRVAEVSGRR